MALDKTKVLSTPGVYYNGVLLAVTPNSVKQNIAGEVKVRAQSSGGTSTTVVSGTDAETLKSMVGWSMAYTAANLELAREIKQNSLNGVPAVIQVVSSTTQDTYETMFMVNEPELDSEPEADIEIEMEGNYVA